MMMTAKAEDYLHRDRLRTISLLKYLQSFPNDTRLLHAQGPEGEAVMLLLRTAVSPYDRETYSGTRHVSFIASDHRDLTLRLVAQVPDEGPIVFKLSQPADEAAVATRFRLRRTTAFHSFRLADRTDWAEASGLVRAAPSEAAFALFEERGYERGWLISLVDAGRAFVVEAPADGTTLSACFVFENGPGLWEIGGLATDPAARRQGLARQVVQTAFLEVQRRGHIARYVAEETNGPSLALARALGLHAFQCLTHFLSDDSR